MVSRASIRPPEFAELEAFVLAVDEGSIARTAERLQISGPAVAKRLRQLEALSNAALLVRGRRGVRPTEAGQRLYPVARDLLADRARAVEALSEHHASDPLRISGMRQVIGSADVPTTKELFRHTQELLAALFHATRECVAITRAEDRVICEINDATVKLIGYRQEELRGRRVAELDLWEDLSARDELVRRSVATGQAQEGELVVVTKNKRKRPVRARIRAIGLHGDMYCLLLLQALVT